MNTLSSVYFVLAASGAGKTHLVKDLRSDSVFDYDRLVSWPSGDWLNNNPNWRSDAEIVATLRGQCDTLADFLVKEAKKRLAPAKPIVVCGLPFEAPVFLQSLEAILLKNGIVLKVIVMQPSFDQLSRNLQRRASAAKMEGKRANQPTDPEASWEEYGYFKSNRDLMPIAGWYEGDTAWDLTRNRILTILAGEPTSRAKGEAPTSSEETDPADPSVEGDSDSDGKSDKRARPSLRRVPPPPQAREEKPVDLRGAKLLSDSPYFNDPGIADFLARKSSFVRYSRPFMYSPALSSEDVKRNVQANISEVVSYFPNEEEASRMMTDIDLAALDLGVLPSRSQATINPLTNPRYKRVIDILLEMITEGIHKTYDRDGLTHGVKFNNTSNVGVVSSSSTHRHLNCASDLDSKNQVLTLSKEAGAHELVQPVLVGWRLQVEKASKAGKRPSLLIRKERVVESTVHNSFHGQRGRHVVSYPWISNVQMMIFNSLFMADDQNPLMKAWKFTLESLHYACQGKYVLTMDVSNNDHTFNEHVLDYIHLRLLPDELYDIWKKTQTGTTIIGQYRDYRDRDVKYVLDNASPGLMSGEALTALSNKVMHTAHQIIAYSLARSSSRENIEHIMFPISRVEVEKILGSVVVNNGDDILFFCDSSSLRDKVREKMETTSIAVYTREDNSFSGAYFDCENDVGQARRVVVPPSSLFVGILEKERRNFDSALGSLPFNSILGRIDWALSFPFGDESVMHSAVRLVLDIHAFGGDLADLRSLADEELELAENSKKLTRAAAISRLTRKLGLKNSARLWYDFSYEQMANADKEAAELMFMFVPINKFARASVLEHMQKRPIGRKANTND